jgi:hopene-associated glycosyltransferase HpnB
MNNQYWVAAIPLIIWAYLLFGRGGFSRVSKLYVPSPVNIPLDKRIAVVIPARNEAEVIGQALTSLFEQDFPTPLHIFLVDDNSTDGTAEVAKLAAQRSGHADSLTVIAGQPLAPGWTGKLWAQSQGVARADLLQPDYLLLTDADIVHSRHSVAELVAIAESRQCDLVSYMVKLACVSFAEKALIPAFVFFFLKLYPPAWIAAKHAKAAGAAGGCILIRPIALQRLGGLAAIRNEMIDDCALAKAVKRTGGRIWMGLTGTTASIRSYGTFGEVGRMVSRTAFNQLQHSTPLLAGTVVGLFLTYLLPPALLFSGDRISVALGAAAWLLMTLAYLPMVRFYNRSWVWALSLPLVACFYLGATVHSAAQYWRGKGGEWKGRLQDIKT